jgi:hypothetical protein
MTLFSLRPKPTDPPRRGSKSQTSARLASGASDENMAILFSTSRPSPSQPVVAHDLSLRRPAATTWHKDQQLAEDLSSRWKIDLSQAPLAIACIRAICTQRPYLAESLERDPHGYDFFFALHRDHPSCVTPQRIHLLAESYLESAIVPVKQFAASALCHSAVACILANPGNIPDEAIRLLHLAFRLDPNSFLSTGENRARVSRTLHDTLRGTPALAPALRSSLKQRAWFLQGALK